ncbi:MAG: hypothetical protein QM622_05055 [Microbacterium sp.]
MTKTEPPVVWQRVPQGWIELVAFADDELAQKWWRTYLSPAGVPPEVSADGVVDAATIATLTRGFDAAREALRDSPYAVAGIFPYLVDDPTVFFIGTTVLPAPADERAARTAASLSGLVRFGDEARSEPFVALDGRIGSATLGRATTDDGTSFAAITGEVPLPSTSAGGGTVFVLALSLDPERLDELAPYAALALDSTCLLAPDQAPPAYPPHGRVTAWDRAAPADGG